MKLDIYISDPADFCRGGYNLRWAFGALGDADSGRKAPDNWVFVQTIEIDETLIDHATVLKRAEAAIDKEEEKVRAEFATRMAAIEKARGELLALPGVSHE